MSELKGTVQRDFRPPVFWSHNLNLHGLKYFQIGLRICQVIQSFQSPQGMRPGESFSPGYETRRVLLPGAHRDDPVSRMPSGRRGMAQNYRFKIEAFPTQGRQF